MITVKQKGNFRKTDRFFNNALSRKYLGLLDVYAKRGLDALIAATPRDTGNTANSWDYFIESENGYSKIVYTNSNTVNGMNVAILLIYGHGTGNGGYVQGTDFVSPALTPVFEQLADQIYMEVTK